MKTFTASTSPALRHLFCAAIAIPLAALPVSAITVTPSSSATDLVNVIKGPAIIYTANETFTGSATSAGIFSGALANGIGIDSGIVLTSGDATLIGNTNTSDSITGDNALPGDALLSALAGYETYDATVLAFDFKTTSGNLYFNFVFGSDEYNEWANTPYNDTFAFTVDGVNIALLPGILPPTPISIDTVNGGNPLGVDPQHPKFYHNNAIPATGGPSPYPFEYDGFTVVFTASVTGLDTATHNMRLAIADGSDYVLDSGVFIQAGTFDEEEHPVPDATASALLLALGLIAVSAFARRLPRVA